MSLSHGRVGQQCVIVAFPGHIHLFYTLIVYRNRNLRQSFSCPDLDMCNKGHKKFQWIEADINYKFNNTFPHKCSVMARPVTAN